MESINNIVSSLNGILFSNYTVYALLFTGVLFTFWSGFGQFRALTHGVAVVRGKYDDKNDPGAINHFQALSAALSATVGLGNIGGVALAVALGGPGAIFWMWIIGIVGMALKMTEVTQSMLYRDTSNPEEPHGGPMFVVQKGFKKWGLGPIGSIIGGIFVITLIISAITGGNMFQAWNVADVTFTYFGVPQIATGAVLAVIVGMVIIGGIKRIGSVAGKIVPFMCILYIIAAAYVLLVNFGKLPEMIMLIVKSGLPLALGGSNADPSGAFLGGTFGYAALWGIKRALFSSEAGQGSSPIAHSAAKTDEPVREGIVAGLEPFIDTIVVCTLTALVIFSTGAYNRPAVTNFTDTSVVSVVPYDQDGTPGQDVDENGVPLWTITSAPVPDKTAQAKRIQSKNPEESGWQENEKVFMIVHADQDKDTGRDLRKIKGTLTYENDHWIVKWDKLASKTTPSFVIDEDNGEHDIGIYDDYAGAALTAHAFDIVQPGLGKWLVVFASWLFAVSTMISWSYYGEQGIVYLFNRLGDSTTRTAILLYKVIYCLLIVVTCLGFITTADELDMWTTLGLGVMLVANIPIMLIFGKEAMKAYHEYGRKLKAGEFHPHATPKMVDVVEGHDVE